MNNQEPKNKQKVIQNINEFIEKVDNMKKQDKLDLSSDQDLSIAIMNLVSIEEHFFFTGSKLNKPHYFDLLQEIRVMRGELLKKIVKDPEGEIWCISKHLLAASMRLMEVGTKQQGMGKKEEAQELFQKAYNLYSLFWGINMKLIDSSDLQKIDEGSLNKHENNKIKLALKVEDDSQSVDKNTVKEGPKNPGENNFMGKLGELVKKAVNCCIE